MTGDFILYVYKEGVREAEEYASYRDRFGYKASYQKYLNMKKSEGAELSDADKVLTDCLFYGVKVMRDGFKTLMRSLRQHDEIGLSNEIYSSMEEIMERRDIVAVSLGTPSITERDFKEYTV